MTLFGVMRQPKWIAALVLALSVAALFAFLGRWQAERSVSTSGVVAQQTETVIPLTQVAMAQQPMKAAQLGQMVSTTGFLAPEDFSVIAERINAGVVGYWVIGRLVLAETPSDYSQPSVAVALGWSENRATAESIQQRLSAGAGLVLRNDVGRYLASEDPQPQDFRDHSAVDAQLTTMSIPALINRWTRFSAPSAVYSGYLVLSVPAEGLVAIDSPTPQKETELNWLNIFYAVEWSFFAFFAIFIWYRLVRDAWQRERDS